MIGNFKLLIKIFIKLLYFIKYDKLLKFKQNYVNKKILNLI